MKAAVFAVAVILCLVAALGFLFNSLLEGEGKKKKKAVQQVTLLKPPPPPPPKEEKPPEPEVRKEEIKEEIIEPGPEPEDAPQDQPPPGPDLGVDAEGGAGSDAFGLVGKKGGAALVGSGGGGSGSPLSRFGFYARVVEKEITKRLNEAGKTPSGQFSAVVNLVLDQSGNILSFDLANSSGNAQVDDLIRKAVELTKSFNQPIPEGMPTTMKVRITTTG